MLPIHDVLDPLKRTLAERTAAVLVAPPGAGKTTVVPLALKDEPWVEGRKIIVLEPRRLAARAAAARMASTLGEKVGETVGFRVRMQSKVSPRTRIEVVTEGVFTRMILDDPGLEGVAAILFDEFHERSLDADLGLAFARDVQGLLRDDLRLLVMSATLDGARVSALLDDAPVVESEGRMFPVDTRHLGRNPAERLEDAVAKAVMKALAEEGGSLLVFLPGQGEIRRVEERLAERVRDPSVMLAPLYGALDPADQDRAVEPAPPGRRKVVLATSIAETSLTIQGVRVVIDCGLARVPRYDPASGLTRLETVRVSRAAADQRRGRAGRTEPGVCYRLWEEPETRSLPPFARPEILETDLSRLALDLARWGARGPEGLAFLDPPPQAAWREARTLLQRLQALDAHGDLTEHGRALADLPLPPRLAHMVVEGAAAGAAGQAGRVAALLTERGLGGADTDLRTRLERLERDGSAKARDAKALARRWADSAVRHAKTVRAHDADPGLLLAEAYPERIARARGKPGEYLLASGRGVFLDPSDALAREPWLAVGELGGGESRDRVLLAAPLDEAALLDAFADRLEVEERIEPDPRGKIRARELRRLGRIVVGERLIDDPDPALIAAALMNEVERKGLSVLPWSERSASLRERAAFLRGYDPSWPDLSDEALLDRREDWLAPLLMGRTSLKQVDAGALSEALIGLIPWELQRRLDADAPERFEAPTGSRLKIDYGAEGGPRVEVRVQELFGLTVHPTLAGGRAPLTLALTSPAHRPVQVTKDLPGFWKGSWADVRSDMRGRYPKHPWPEDPTTAPPTTRAKPRGT
ncbi:ATP-dependent helicase HrpB [Caulobacter sp. 17J80-11]|uniref:ATP-dependent helicase HrpB n=1 Tax=Caulobacter sp. 17J80-11 TaxID=2763502 RepID=UPI0016537CC4|nr:ATP-dependent helicase HrpB [Caulobacter sp. 17J80-11]MBC6980668.1 ATP-dependent helicase HrpB [Caulobacter sp. 17J80-11]